MSTVKPDVKYLDPTLEVDVEKDPRGLGGLIALVEGKEMPLPLRKVKVRADMTGDCCRTVVEQHFRNELDNVMEAIHIFPLPEDGAIVEMELVAGEVVVKAECLEREKAEKIFIEARQEGYQAGLLTQERADVHTLRVTNLPPQTDVMVRIIVVERLESVDGRWRWRFPTVIAPRYLAGVPVGHEGPGVLPDSDHVPDASHLQPPLRLDGGTTLDLEVRIHGHVHELESSLHAVRLDLGEDGKDGIRVAPSQKASLDRDFILAYSTANENEIALRAYTDGDYTLVVLEPPSVELPDPLSRDAVFVVDRSGSMRGFKMGAAKLALKSALHGLQEGDRFRLISFSNDTQIFASGFSDYTQVALEQADRWIDQIEASGGTEMLPAIREALSGPDVEGRVCTILLITDGQVWNEAELVAAVANRRDQARFFTMGIDTAISAALLKRLARVGGGTCELLTPSEDIEAAVVRMEACFGSPIAEDVHLERSKPADGNPKSLFIGRPASWLVEDAPAAILARGKSSGGSFKFETIPVKIEFPLGALWARERIAMLEDWITLRPHEEEAIRPEIVRIALQHQIASRYTAFVAVEKSKKITGERVEIVQPVELPAGWDQTFLGVPGVDQIRGATLKSSVHYAMPAPPLMRDMKFSAAQESRQRPGHVLKRDQVEEKSVTPPRKESLDGQLSRLQGADGSFGGDVKRTAAALLALLLLGHTQRKGIRRRTVLKAAKWLEGYPSDPLASLALEALKREEEDRSSRKLLSSKDDELKELYAAGTEGKLLKQAWDLSK